MQFYNEINVASIRYNSVVQRLFCEALDDLGRDVQKEDGGDEREG